MLVLTTPTIEGIEVDPNVRIEESLAIEGGLPRRLDPDHDDGFHGSLR
jgi:hypothetical protein